MLRSMARQVRTQPKDQELWLFRDFGNENTLTRKSLHCLAFALDLANVALCYMYAYVVLE